MKPPLQHQLSLLFIFFFTRTTSLTAPTDIAALFLFKSHIAPTSIPTTSCLGSWNFTSDPCRPASPSHFTCGLTCSLNSTRITAISLDPAGYSSTLPPSLSNLTLLAHLILASNSFHGPIPAPLFSLPNLQTLILSSNALSGPIPPLTHLPTLQTLDLSHNHLTGPIPDSLSSLTNLVNLDLSFNQIHGTLPNSLPPNLIELALRENMLSGTIRRSTFSRLTSLEVAEMAGNRIEGKIEGWFLLLPSLQQVDLANNSLKALEVWGEGRVVAIDLSFNLLEGALPVGLARFPLLTALSVRHNRLRGEIPGQYLKNKKGVPFRRLFLDGNFLKGRVPRELLGKGGGDVKGSVGDNCLVGCPSGLEVCSPVQKPDWVCRQVYSAGSSGGG